MTAQQFENISKIVFEDKQEVNCSTLAKALQIHIDDAKTVLDKFAQKNESKLIIEYMVANGDDGDSTKVQRMLIVSKDELESTKSKFKNPTVYPYSIRTADGDVNSVLNFEKFLIDGDDFLSIQKLGHIHNEQITSRPNRRKTISKAKPAEKPIKQETKESPFIKKETVKQEEKPSISVKTEPESKIDALKEVSANVSSPRKRANQSKDEFNEDEIDGDVIKRKRKRVVIEDSDEDSKDGEFMVTKIKEEAKDEEPSKPSVSPKTQAAKKTEPAKPKGKPIKNQPSIMNFFKKA